MIITRTPFRVSFFGGGTDHPAWFLKHGGSVLGTSIDKYCYVFVRRLPRFFPHKHRIVYSQTEEVSTIDEIKNPVVRECLKHMEINDGIEVFHAADLPTRTGVATSSAFTVGLLHALHTFQGKVVPKKDLYHEAILIEQKKIGDTVGCQDQTFASVGGLNRIDFKRNGEIIVSPFVLPKEHIEYFQKQFMLFFTGFTRYSSQIEADKVSQFDKKEKELFEMSDMVSTAYELLRTSKFDAFGRLLNDGWKKKKALSNLVSKPEIDMIYNQALSAGALGGKLSGAGGGGFMLLYVPEENQESVRKELKGLLEIPFKFEHGGSQVVFYNHD